MRSTGNQHSVCGLFAGIGGIELGLSRSGHAANLLCEKDPGATEVLRAGFPDIKLCGDINLLRRLPPETTMLVAGFPCQDLSQAGRTQGISGRESGLVGNVFRLLKRKRVPCVLLENVPFMLQLGRGAAMTTITKSLEALGYSWAYRVVDSRSFGLPQRRRRVYLLASLLDDPRPVLFADESGPDEPCHDHRDVACGFYWTEGTRGLGWAVNAIPTLKGGSSLGIPSPPAIRMIDGRLVTPDVRDAERLQGFPSNWTKPAERVARTGARWRLIGNAVNVKVSEWLGKRLADPGDIKVSGIRPHTAGSAWPRAAWNIGNGVMEVEASEFPVKRKFRNLEDFLIHEPQLLSAKATEGFYRRAKASSLNIPTGFLAQVRVHQSRMRGQK